MIRAIDKRNYTFVGPEVREQLLYRSLVKGMSVRQAARELRINYPTAKVIVQKQRTKYKRLAERTKIPVLQFDKYVFSGRRQSFEIPDFESPIVIKGVSQMISEIQKLYNQDLDIST